MNNSWRLPQNPRMDSHLVYNPNTDQLVIKVFRLIEAGDLIAVAQFEDGRDGVFVWADGFSTDLETEEEAFLFVHKLRGQS